MGTVDQIDLEVLPEEARREIIDFYKSLVKKYRQKTLEDIEKEIMADKVQINTKNWKFNREEIYD